MSTEELLAFVAALALIAWWILNRADGKAGEAPASAPGTSDGAGFAPRFSG